jgi:hypothetical protein
LHFHVAQLYFGSPSVEVRLMTLIYPTNFVSTMVTHTIRERARQQAA